MTRATTKKAGLLKSVGALVVVGVLSATLVAQTAAATRYDNQIQTTLTQKLAAKNQFRGVQSSVNDGIVTLTGTVDLYQRKLDAAKRARCATGAETGQEAALCALRLRHHVRLLRAEREGWRGHGGRSRSNWCWPR